MLFSLGLFFWSTTSIIYNSVIPAAEYLTGIIVLAIFVSIIWKLDRAKIMRKGVVIAAVFMNMGLSIAYRMAEGSQDKLFLGSFKDAYTGDLILMLAAFLITYLGVRGTRI